MMHVIRCLKRRMASIAIQLVQADVLMSPAILFLVSMTSAVKSGGHAVRRYITWDIALNNP